jgi:hypothetical protein
MLDFMEHSESGNPVKFFRRRGISRRKIRNLKFKDSTKNGRWYSIPFGSYEDKQNQRHSLARCFKP